MNRTFYFYANVLLGLGVAAGIVEGILRLSLGRQLFFRDWFMPWLTLLTVLFIAGGLYILKYYRHKNYRFTFWFGIATFVLNLLLAGMLYIAVVNKETPELYIPTMMLLVVVGVVYSISLMLLPGKENIWLRAAGATMLALGVVFSCSFAWGILNSAEQVGGTSEKVNAWIAMAQAFIPLFFMKQFDNDAKRLPQIAGDGIG